MIYRDKPLVLRVTYGPAEAGEAEAVYLIGVTPAQVVAALTKLKDETPALSVKKDRKPRRTKAEMAKGRGPILDGDAFHGDKMPDEDEERKKPSARRTGPASGRPGEEMAGATPQTTGRSAGEEAMDRLKKQAAEDQPKESVWP